MYNKFFKRLIDILLSLMGLILASWLYLIINNPDLLFPRTLRQVYYMVKTYNIKDERP